MDGHWLYKSYTECMNWIYGSNRIRKKSIKRNINLRFRFEDDANTHKKKVKTMSWLSADSGGYLPKVHRMEYETEHFPERRRAKSSKIRYKSRIIFLLSCSIVGWLGVKENSTEGFVAFVRWYRSFFSFSPCRTARFVICACECQFTLARYDQVRASSHFCEAIFDADEVEW